MTRVVSEEPKKRLVIALLFKISVFSFLLIDLFFVSMEIFTKEANLSVTALKKISFFWFKTALIILVLFF
jgi:hypothetical protein